MILADKLTAERHTAKNAVEEYVYDMRDKMYGKFEHYITESDKEAWMSVLTQVEDWLYGDGENCKKQVYVDKLAELRVTGDCVVRRYTEHEGRQPALNMLGASLVHTRKIMDLAVAQDEKYNHLTEDEVKVLATKEQEIMIFFNDACNKSNTQALHDDPAVTVASINSKRKELEDKVNPIINKPKPKVEPPPAPAEPAPTDKTAPEGTDAPMEEGAAAADPAAAPADPAPADPAPAPQDTPNMDLD